MKKERDEIKEKEEEIITLLIEKRELEKRLDSKIGSLDIAESQLNSLKFAKERYG